jgi:methionine biosynthesis protein MetW
LHQLHLLRRGTYLVDLGERYTLKRNRHSSHMQILDAIPNGSRVLDLGCGQSLLAEELARKNVTLIGVDKIAEDRVSPAVHQYVRRDLDEPLNLPFGREFDYVVLSDLIEHLGNRDAVMESLRRFLKLDGRLIISTGNIAIWFYRISLLIGRFEYGARGILDRTHVHLFTLDTFERFLKRNGYRIIEMKTTPIPFEVVFSSTGRSQTLDRFTRWYYNLTRLWPRMFAYQFIMECTFAAYEFAYGEEEWAPGEQPSQDDRETGSSFPGSGGSSDR